MRNSACYNVLHHASPLDTQGDIILVIHFIVDGTALPASCHAHYVLGPWGIN